MTGSGLELEPPPTASIRSRTEVRPSPVPRRRVVKQASVARSRTDLAIPVPRSITASSRASPSRLASSRTD